MTSVQLTTTVPWWYSTAHAPTTRVPVGLVTTQRNTIQCAQSVSKIQELNTPRSYVRFLAQVVATICRP